MRKIKKINGFLVVKFNDREKREYAAMDISEVEELLQKVMLYADLEGRVVEDG